MLMAAGEDAEGERSVTIELRGARERDLSRKIDEVISFNYGTQKKEK